ncbi:MAG: GT4 family glycosyltransferase PelF [Pseudomonadales bacterium]
MSRTVLMLLEGTYPFVRGGVSSWIHQIIRGMPEFTFDLLFIGGSRKHYGRMQYELPPNVRELKCHYLEDAWESRRGHRQEGPRAAFEAAETLHDSFRSGCPKDSDLFSLLDLVASEEPAITHEQFLFSRSAWDSIVRSYEARCTDPSFLNYFWTVRSMHAPVFLLAEVARRVRPPKIIHSISTGYAGLLAAMLKGQNPDCAFILSEHGIYTKERKIDLSQADWIKEPSADFEPGLTDDVGYIRQMWIRFYQQLGRITYEAADPIISLYGGNQARQIADGARPERTRVIPNGIPLAPYAGALDARPAEIPKVVGFIGRVVPIKDVKTFLRAMRTICSVIPEMEGWIVGPTEEDEDYAAECRGLVASLGLSERVKFLGFQKVSEILPQIGVLTLTSISEAQPLVILEGYAAGVPCVATDVGSCREMIEGAPGEDAALGVSGSVVGISDPVATADACLELFQNPQKWAACQRAALARVERFYTEALMFERYRGLYRDALVERG